MVRNDNRDWCPRFQFHSDELEPQPAFNELIDTIELLEYLESEKLIRKYHPAATIVPQYDEKGHSISLGKSETKKSVVFFVEGMEKYGNFIKVNENYRFVALEPLRAHVDRNFITIENKSAQDANRNARLRNRIALGVALVTAIGIWVSAHQNDQSRDDLLMQLAQYNRRHNNDSISIERLRDQLTVMRTEIDSLKKSDSHIIPH